MTGASFHRTAKAPLTAMNLLVLVCWHRFTAKNSRVVALSLLFVAVACETPSEISILRTAPWATALGWNAAIGLSPCTLSGIGCNADGKVSSV